MTTGSAKAAISAKTADHASLSGSGVKASNALRRGLEVLFAIEHSSAATLAELHRQTGVPKASLQGAAQAIEDKLRQTGFRPLVG